MPELDYQDERLKALGQITIVRAALDELEHQLMDWNIYVPTIGDAISNVSFQTGVLVGINTRVVDAA